MKTLLILLLITMSFNAIARQTDTLPPQQPGIVGDTTELKYPGNLTNYYDTYDSIREQANMERNINTMVELQRQNTSRQKKAAMLRIGFGIAMLAVLIVGLARRKKK